MMGEVIGRFSGGRWAEEGVVFRLSELDLTRGVPPNDEPDNGGEVGPVFDRVELLDGLLGKTELDGERISGLESKLIIPPPAVVVLARPVPLPVVDGPGEWEMGLNGVSG